MNEGELLSDIEAHLNPLERIVLSQLASPNVQAAILAEVDAGRGKKPGHKVVISYQNMADGLGIPMDLFLQAQERIKTVTKLIMSESDHGFHRGGSESSGYSESVAYLCEAFEVQVPGSMKSDSSPEESKLAVRRLFTIAARARPERVTTELASHITRIGAKVPDTNGCIMRCFGVLYEDHNPLCSACALKSACQVEAQSTGFDGKMSINARLIGAAASQRIPILLPRSGAAHVSRVEDDSSETQSQSSNLQSAGYAVSSRDTALFEHMVGHYKQARHGNLIYFKPQDSNLKRYSFMIAPLDGSQSIVLNFCSPSKRLALKLDNAGHRAYRLNGETPLDEALQLIDEHARERLLSEIPKVQAR